MVRATFSEHVVGRYADDLHVREGCQKASWTFADDNVLRASSKVTTKLVLYINVKCTDLINLQAVFPEMHELSSDPRSSILGTKAEHSYMKRRPPFVGL